MNGLIRSYVLSRGARVAVLVLLSALGIAALGALLPTTPLWVGLRLILLLSGLLWAFRSLQTPALAFFLITFLALLLFHKPIETYVKTLYSQAQSASVFMVVLFGGTLAIVSRQDLFNALSQISGATRRSPEQSRISREIAVLCLLRRFDTWIQHTVASPWWRAVLLFPLVLANFVSSGTTVLFFKSLWASAHADFRTVEADRALAAGILCFCTCGPLLIYLPGVVSSPWWLFFNEAVSANQALQVPRLPLAV